jgi:hypothetical protein
MSADPAGSLHHSLDRLAEVGTRHLRRCGFRRARRTRLAALALFDEQLQLRDRLVTADEFVRLAHRDGFVAAAIDDAVMAAQRAQEIELARIAPEVIARKWQKGLHVLIGLAALALLLWLALRHVGSPPDVIPLAGLAAADRGGGLSASRVDRTGAPHPPQIHAVDEATRANATPSLDATPGKGERGASPAAPLQGGQSGRAQPSGASASSKGMPSNRAAGDDDESGESGSAARASKSSHESASEQAQSPGEQTRQADNLSAAGSSPGSGGEQQQSAAGSNGIRERPGESQQKSAELGHDGQQGQKRASGAPGAQQSQQKGQQIGAQGQSTNPGTSNNRSPGKGKGASKDALKKSRGVASMILGVPIPDRVVGLPNPGLVRTEQKKAASKEEPVSAVAAQDRGARTRPLGRIDHAELTTAMKALVRDYFSRAEGQP